MKVVVLLGLCGALTLKPKALVQLELGLDPHCAKGLANTEMTACCQADCGECSDASDVCAANATSGRGTTCCPSIMLDKDLKLASCDNSMAPCAISEEVRNPPSVASLTASTVHAKDDCGEAVKDTKNMLDINTHYVKFAAKKAEDTTDCNTQFGTMAQAAAACSNKDDCNGFTASGETPKCLLVSGNEIKPLADDADDLYLKREDGYTGQTFQLRIGDTTKSLCCNGNQTVSGVVTGSVKCFSTSGTEAKMGLCSAAVAMNADAMPDNSKNCSKVVDLEKVCE